LEDLGFAPQRQLWEQLGRPPVIHSEIILQDPEGALRQLCTAIDLPFDVGMLSWPEACLPDYEALAAQAIEV